ncbi:hypothetical protein GCM10027187_40690 [Streptosporangium sandarakinum]|uniref:DUF6884 domain-containing protein n=1 Tax=Streptosporangium sandarakinum TaxID=1260955 RepID=A0A852V931_9ACTN|nr:DUF6884 domain-containing protein [Streptosporangium sandarakinum]NYF44600.1 hypothetical protein [Streptosporangium sandarakinum]
MTATLAAPTPTATRVVIVPCGGKKADTTTAVPAADLYVGSYHRAARRAADTLTAGGGRVLILSALHGLVPLDQLVAPYELRAGQAGTVTGETLHAQAAALGITDADVTVLGGRAYVELARQVWPNLNAPLAGTRGIGEQMARLAAIYKPTPARQAPAAPIDREALWQSCREHAEARHVERLAKEARRRAAYVTADTLRIAAGRASVRFSFPTGAGAARVAARMRAACRFAAANGVTTTQLDAATLQAHGAPERVARFASALPRLVELVEGYTALVVRHYGRWERHSSAARHLDGVSEVERRAHLRAFRARAFDVIVATLLRPDTEPAPQLDGDAPLWEQADAIAAQYAEYGWFDVTGKADDVEVTRLLETALVDAPPAVSAVAVPLPAARALPRPARRRTAARRARRSAAAFDQLDLFAA